MIAGVRRKRTQELKVKKHVRRTAPVRASVAIVLDVVDQLPGYALTLRGSVGSSRSRLGACPCIELVGGS